VTEFISLRSHPTPETTSEIKPELNEEDISVFKRIVEEIVELRDAQEDRRSVPFRPPTENIQTGPNSESYKQLEPRKDKPILMFQLQH
jgi:hypothetical protein